MTLKIGQVKRISQYSDGCKGDIKGTDNLKAQYIMF